MIRVVHFSDVHVRGDFGLRDLRRMGWRRSVAFLELTLGGRARDFGDAGGTLGNLVSCVRELKPDHVLFSGDFTALATESEFADARTILGDLASDPMKFSCVPGNHDRYTPNSLSSRRFEKHFGHLLKSDLTEFSSTETGFPWVRFIDDDLAILGIDTTRVAPFPGISFGQVSGEQLAFVRAILSSKQVQRRRVMALMHHAPRRMDGRSDTLTHGLLGADDLMAALKAHPRLTIHCGHIHRRYELPETDTCPRLFNSGSGTLHRAPGFFVFDLEQGPHGLDIASVRQMSVTPAP